ncbi:hypothetical protein [Winogradskyella sp.]|uniref:hypothetical protein n=1 Tax=Winogradskyella sp. TaxID=1883156 RepID=UPI003BAA2C7A
MESKSNFTSSELIWASLFFGVLGLILVYAQSISSYLIEAYNQNIDSLASNLSRSPYILSY